MYEYDLLIPCAEKDLIKLPLCIERAVKYFSPPPSQIYIVSPVRTNISGIKHIYDDKILPIKMHDIIYRRKNWIFQQLIKLKQQVTSDNYMCLDCDVFLNKKIPVFHENKTNLFLTNFEARAVPKFRNVKKIKKKSLTKINFEAFQNLRLSVFLN